MTDIVTKKDPKNQVPAPPLTTALIDSRGNVSKSWAVFFRELYNRTSYKGSNAIDNNITTLDELIEQVKINVSSIQTNAGNIQANTDDIQTNIDNIQANTDAILSIANALNDHVNDIEAHDSNGKIVGFNDLANESTVGLVLRMAEVSNAVYTVANVSAPYIGAAPATYDQAYTQATADLANESKAAIFQLKNRLNAAITILNNLIAASKAAGQMTTP